jgi:hypothetical protein
MSFQNRNYCHFLSNSNLTMFGFDIDILRKLIPISLLELHIPFSLTTESHIRKISTVFFHQWSVYM